MSNTMAASDEVEMVNRLLMRLALTEDAQLEKVLSKLLPYALSLMASTNNPTRVKVTEMLSHINKRVKEQLAIKLPLLELVKLYKGQETSVVKNFSLIYVEMAFERSPCEEKLSVVPDLLSGLSSLPLAHRDVLLRLAAKGLEEGKSDTVYENLASKLKAALSAADLSLLTDFAIQSLLYQPLSTAESGTVRPPPGLSLAQATRVSGKVPLTAAQLIGRKIGLLNLLSRLELSPQVVYPLFLVAASDSNDLVAKKGEELLKKNASRVDLEDVSLVKRLFSMFQETPPNVQVEAAEKVSAASLALRVRIVGALTHSVAAANTFPLPLICIFECINGEATTKRLKQAGMEFTVWVFKHASDEQLKRTAPFFLSSLVKLLDSDSSLKAFGYQAIAQLARRVPEHFSDKTEFPKRLFNDIRSEPTIRGTIQEALNALAQSYKNCSTSVTKDIEDLLFENVKAPEAEARFCAVFWATRVFDSTHVPSRFLCMLAADDAKLDIRELSQEGLNVSTEEGSATWPPFEKMIAFICGKQPALLSPSVVGERILLFPPKQYVAMVSYLMKCYEVHRSTSSTGFDTLCSLLEHGMAYEGTSELHALCSAGLLTLASHNPNDFAMKYREKIQWITQFIGDIDMGTRQAISQILGIVSGALGPDEASNLLQRLVSGFSSSRFEDVHGAVCSTGYILAQCRSGAPAVHDKLQKESVAALAGLLGNEKFSGFAAEALGHAGLRGPLPLSPGDLSTWTAEAVSAEKLSLTTLVSHLRTLLCSKDTKVVQKAVIALGHLCFGNPLPQLLDISITSLIDLSKSKVEDVLLAVGEALAFIWGVIPVTPDTILYSNFMSLSSYTSFLRDDSSSNVEIEMRTPETSDRRASSRDRIVKALLEELVYSSRKEERCAASVWLLSLVSYCGNHQHIQALLPRIQEAFSYLLGEQNELTQEMASRGMSIVYELGDAAMKEELVKALVGTLSGTAKRKRPIKLMEDSEVFEKGAIGEAPSGGNISTYKELCSLANEMGQPDLVYKFMDLANYQTSLNSKRGAAFGFAKIAKRAGHALEPHLRSLVPKLLRYQHDPNKHIQDAMGHIWKAIVAEPKKTIDQFFNDIMEDLITNAGSRFWRSREAACMALADVIQGRKFTEVEKYLLQIWTMAFRAMDDIKESVRNAGGSLCRGITGLTSRLCDTSLTSEAEARATIGIVLPFLLSSGIASSVADIQQASIRMVMKLVKTAGPAIRPQLPDLVVCMLESLSSLEDQRLNYAEMHAERLGVSTEKLDSARFSIAKESPMWETLDYCLRQVDQQTLELLVPRLTQLVRSGVGTNTRAGVARFIALLAQQLAGNVKPYTGVLIKALTPTVISERNVSVKRALAAAYASALKYSGERIQSQQISDVVEMYKSGDKEKRIASGLLFKELTRQASDCIKSYQTMVLPVAFLARFDEDASIRSDFEEVWEENTSSQSVAVQLYLPEIAPLLLSCLASSSWGQKQQSAQAIVRVAEVAGDAVEPYADQFLSSLLNELRGRLWEGKECILEAIAAVCKACPSFFGKSPALTPRIVAEAIITACSRKKGSFRAAAYSALEKVVEALKSDAELFELVAPAVLEEIGVSDAEPESSSSAETGRVSVPLDKAFACLTASIRTGTESTILPWAAKITSAASKALQGSWQVRISALQCVQEFVQRCPSGLFDEKLQDEIVSLVLDCVTSIKISQVHSSALECLKAILKTLLPSSKLTQQQKLEGRLRELLEVEKTAQGRSLLNEMVSSLSNMNIDQV